MEISLTPELSHLVEAKLASGLYADAADVVRDALRRMESNEEVIYQLKLAQLRQALTPGLEQAARGEFVEFSLPDLIADLDREFGSQ